MGDAATLSEIADELASQCDEVADALEDDGYKPGDRFPALEQSWSLSQGPR